MGFPLTPEQAAERLGRSISGLYVMIRSGKIPAHSVGRQWLIPRECFEGYTKAAEERAAEEEGVRPHVRRATSAVVR
jgi:excisionase family DNA binding protein